MLSYSNRWWCLLFLMLLPHLVIAQWQQRVRGTVIEKESKTPVTGAVVILTTSDQTFTSIADSNGHFVMDHVPLGKHGLAITYPGFVPYSMAGLVVISAKETVVAIELEQETVTMKEVTITHKKEHVNDMALVSAKTFDVQETERFAGSRGDPARMASNYAGVQGGNDTRNDIVIRGNSPQGVLWRLEGIDIPNPNHFGVPGTTGGPVSMLNNKTLANCDFFTGAFPAEYGNGIAGVFDLRLRNGNNDRHEFTAQLGLLGTELAAEGPLLRKKGGSYLVAYRYSTLQLFERFHIKIGTSSVPKYQDLTFKLHFPINKTDYFSIFGIGGKSNIDLLVSTLTKPEPELYGDADRDQYFTSNSGTLGIEYLHGLNKNAYTKITVAQTGTDVYANHNKVFRDNNYVVDSLKDILGYDYKTLSNVVHWLVNARISNTQTIRFGLINNLYLLDLTDSSRQYPTTLQAWQHRSDFKGNTDLVQAYFQYKLRIGKYVTLNAGLHGQYLTHNNATAIEPRAAIKWQIGRKTTLTGGYGLHSQMQPIYQYFAHRPGAKYNELHNYDMGFTRSHHMVAGIETIRGGGIRLRAETYYQSIFNVPIEKRMGSSYSALNQGSSYSRDFPDTLQNKGTGYNYGIEVTVEKQMNKGYYALLTASLFDAKARGNDGIYRKTDFNTGYAVNFLLGYEKKTRSNSTLIAGLKVTIAGGRLYSPVDSQASLNYGDAVVVDSLRNTLRLPAYFRTDIKLGYKVNRRKVTHEVGIDLVNILNTRNTLSYTWSYDLATQGKAPYYYQYQLGFLPIFYYRIDFGAGKNK